MEKKTSKVVKVKRDEKGGSPVTFKPKNGEITFYKFLVAFENKDWGEYWTAKDVQDYFVTGETVDYLFEDKGKDKPARIRPHVPDKPKSNIPSGKHISDIRKQAVIDTLGFAVNAWVGNAIARGDIKSLHHELIEYCNDMFDELNV